MYRIKVSPKLYLYYTFIETDFKVFCMCFQNNCSF